MDDFLENGEEAICVSMDGGDSNALILPCKRKNNNAKKTQNAARVQTSKAKKLTKSHKRKLQKLEAEKATKQLLSSSVEILEKCKVNDEVYKLLTSAKKLGQAETSKEKRRRVMQYSQAGLELPYTYRQPETKSSDDNSSMSEPEDEAQLPQVYEDTSDVLKPLRVEEEAISKDSILLDSSLQPICEDEVKGNVCSTKSMMEESSEEQHGQSIRVTGVALSANSASSSREEKVAAADEVGGTAKDNFGSTKSVQNHSSLGAPSVPTVVHVSRPEEVESKRKDLPIVMMEQEIMESINESISVIICGETGCGKTTQVPQFLYEAGFGSKLCDTRSGVIGVTQPRRVAVLATAKRVAFELGLRLGKEVGFQVRYDKRIGENCAIKFMTDGILLREVQGDFLLKRYSVLILDEAHERSLNTDILIGMLSRVIRQRQAIYEEQQKKVLSGEIIDPEARIYPLKLILMSATLRVEDFTSGGRIFREPPPVVEVPTRQYPVTIHFSKRTEIVDYIGQAYKKVLSIHKKLPPGGILVFVTGQREVENLCAKLRLASKDLVQKSSRVNGNEVSKDTILNEIDGYDMMEINEALEFNEQSTQRQTDRFSSYDEPHEEAGDEDSDFSYHSESDSDLEFESVTDHIQGNDSKGDDDDLAEVLGQSGNLDALKAAFSALAGKTSSKPELENRQKSPVTEDGCCNKPDSSLPEKRGENDQLVGPMCVLPLYAMLPAAAQLRVFGNTKEGERLVVVATNVAETSLTIPGVKYVVDTGREKVKKYNSVNGIESYEIQWISKASASQRAGRSGRTGPGHCYRLYSSAVFNNIFDEFSCAEILKTPVDGVVLLMKSMGVSKVANFPFPTPPNGSSLAEAERCLKALEALDQQGRLTSLGKTMAQYPMNPRHSRMLLTSIQVLNKKKHYVRSNLVLGYAIAAAAALSVSNPFLVQFEGSLRDSNSQGQDEKSDSLKDEKTENKQKKLIKKKLSEAAKLSRAKFSNIKSDALTVAYALQCFELSLNPSEFCTDNTLHLKTMEEMSKLRQQILQLVFTSSFRGLQEEYLWSGTREEVEHAWRAPSEKSPLSQVEEDLLLGAICAGWVDRVAKRISRSIQFSEEDKKVNAVSYQACMVEERVYVHRWSSVAKLAPEFLVYSELIHTNRPYIHGASSVQSEWLVQYAGSLCTFSAPLTDPKPGYDYLTDQVYCHVTPYFGPHSWELPYHKMPINDVMSRVTVFAYALLDGQVLPCLKSVRKFMAAQPSIILKRESLGEKRVGNLLSKLNSRSGTIYKCEMLREVWMEYPMELHAELRCWFQAGFKFEELWENMRHEAFLSPQDRFAHKSKSKKTDRRK